MPASRRKSRTPKQASTPSHPENQQPTPPDDNPPAPDTTPLIRLADCHARNITWLWHNRIPLGKPTLLVGDPDSGKSFLALDLAARVSRGRGVPPEPGLGKPGSVLLLSADDDVEDTIVPRLEAAGADLSRIAVLPSFSPDPVDKPGRDPDRLLSLATDFDRLREALDQLPDCRLIVVDPISAYLRGVDGNNNISVRQLLQKIAGLARERHAAVLLVSHHRKQTAATALHRAIGSLAFTAVARVVLMLGTDPAIAGRRLLLPAKMNLHSGATGRAFRIDDGKLDWEPDVIPYTADDLNALSPTTDITSDPRRDAKIWRVDQLKKSRLPAEEIYLRAAQQQIPFRLLWAAKKDAKVRAVRDGKEHRWYWKLPDNWIPNPLDSLVVYI